MNNIRREILIATVRPLGRFVVATLRRVWRNSLRGFGFILGAFVALWLLLPAKALGDTLYIGALSFHYVEGDFCEKHPAVFYERDGWIGGAFRNSYCEPTAFFGRRWGKPLTKDVQLGVTAGGMYGYRFGGVEIEGGRHLSPMITIDVRVQFDPDSWVIPDRPSLFQLGAASALVPGWSID